MIRLSIYQAWSQCRNWRWADETDNLVSPQEAKNKDMLFNSIIQDEVNSAAVSVQSPRCIWLSDLPYPSYQLYLQGELHCSKFQLLRICECKCTMTCFLFSGWSCVETRFHKNFPLPIRYPSKRILTVTSTSTTTFTTAMLTLDRSCGRE